ncbi:MAG: hypothetical protein PUD63_04705 [Clostridia bacterium]|nr:hypothetical protein [Clostridia bacterium]
MPLCKDESRVFTQGEDKDVWLRYVNTGDAVLAHPEPYITLP